MHIDKYRDKDQHEEGDYYVDKDGCSWSGSIDFIQGSILGFCCCGMPEENLMYVYNSLSILNKYNKFKITYDQFKEESLKLHGSEQGSYFMWYFLSERDLTEHGGSVPGWLTEKGIEVMEDIESLNLED